MKWKRTLQLVGIALIAVLFTQCYKGSGGILPEPDEDSDRPEWAGGNTEANEHIKGNDQSGTTRGGDYGDLYVLLRTDNGVPIMTSVDVDQDGIIEDDEHFVQPIDAAGNEIELDQYGEVPEGAPVIEVEFGRLNIVRSPQSVLDQALTEALKVINAGDGFTLDFCGRLMIWNYDLVVTDSLVVTKTIDSPRESMAMYQELMNFAFENKLSKLKLSGIDPIKLAAGCFAAGSDKTGTVDIDEVVYINGFIDCLGCCAIPNDYDYDWSGEIKQYFNFGELSGGNPYNYDRQSTFKDRYLQYYDYVDGVYIPNGDPVSVLTLDTDLGIFKYRWNGNPLTRVDGFACAVDDAVQVLEFVHGNSNIEFVAVPPQ